MSVSFTLTDSPIFHEGTTVKAYPTTNWPTPGQPSGAPIGSASAEGTISGGSVTFSGLEKGKKYWAVAEVGGVYRYVKFIAGEDVSQAASVVHRAELEAAQAAAEASSLPKGQYRFIESSVGFSNTSAASGKKYLLVGNTANVTEAAPGGGGAWIKIIDLLAARLGPATQKLNLEATVSTLATGPNKTIKVGLYPLKVESGLYVPGTVVSGSEVTIEKPTANGAVPVPSGDFAVPTDGIYTFGYTIDSSTPAANFGVAATLLARSV